MGLIDQFHKHSLWPEHGQCALTMNDRTSLNPKSHDVNISQGSEQKRVQSRELDYVLFK